MASFLKELTERLEANGAGTIGVDLFREHMPADASPATLLIATQPIVRSPDVPCYRKGAFSVIVRNDDPDAAHQKCLDISALLDLEEVTLGGFRFVWIHPRHDPLTFPLSAGRERETSVTFDLVYTTSS